MHVTLGGTYGSPPRQMFRCVSPDGSSHRFAGTLPRLVADGEMCQRCDKEVHRHQGRLLTRDYEFHLRLAARALLDVANGLAYTEAAARARATAGRGRYGSVKPNGALVAEWIDVLAPLLVGADAETSGPETVVAASTNIVISNVRIGTSKQALGGGRWPEESHGGARAPGARDC